MSVLNALLAGLVDGLLYPFQDQSPLAGLAVVSLLTAIGMLMVVRATSDQARLAAVKRAIHACVFEIRLFNDDVRAMLRAEGEMVRHNLTYLRLSMVPVLWMIVPLGLFIAQLQFHYGYSGLELGQPALVKVRLKHSPTGAARNSAGAGEPASPAPVLEAPPGIRIETPAVWIPSLGEAAWRIAAERPGDYELTVQLGEAIFTKNVRVSSAIVRRSPVRVEGRLVNQLLYPAEPPLPDGAQVESIAVTYPPRDVRVLGREIHWMVVFFALSMVFAWALRSRFNVVL
jgi:hypothetical protein